LDNLNSREAHNADDRWYEKGEVMTVQKTTGQTIAFDNSYARLPERFFARLAPTPVQAPKLVRLNSSLARQLGFDPAMLTSFGGVALLAGNRIADGGEPLAMAYAGHQFGNFVPQLGDGRAILLGEVIDTSGQRRDIQLKGAGPTPFSRRGDGRAALGPVLREYIVSEAFAALGIPATRALAAVTTGEMVWREDVLPGAVLTRVAASHIRVGTFQYFAAQQDWDDVRTLADYAIARHYPEAANCTKADRAPNRYRALLEGVIARQAALVARWLHTGFIHGVMNTDNMSIAGETIDFGPCAFLDGYDPAKVFSSIDQMGRYAYANQPRIAQWNLARLAETLLPLLADDEDAALKEGQEALETFAGVFERAYVDGLRRKVGILEPRAEDRALIDDLLQLMAADGADFTLTFRRLCACAESANAGAVADADLAALFKNVAGLEAWLQRWRQRLAQESSGAPQRTALMRGVNPAYIPRNHLVEEAIAAAVGAADFSVFERLVTVLATPYVEQPGAERFAAPPRPEQVVQQTFCGT
jgi:serine/tyrosine/threonine adenylyltransferase